MMMTMLLLLFLLPKQSDVCVCMRTHKRTSFVNCQKVRERERARAIIPHLCVPIIRCGWKRESEKNETKEKKLVHTLKISIWTRLQTNCQVDYVVIGGRTIETWILSRACTRLARLMTWPTYSTLIGKTPWWASAYASAVMVKGREREKKMNTKKDKNNVVGSDNRLLGVSDNMLNE